MTSFGKCVDCKIESRQVRMKRFNIAWHISFVIDDNTKMIKDKIRFLSTDYTTHWLTHLNDNYGAHRHTCVHINIRYITLHYTYIILIPIETLTVCFIVKKIKHWLYAEIKFMLPLSLIRL